jgi:cyclic pyranopterin phosphate synthase
MVDVGGKQVTVRTAKAEGYVLMRPETLRVIRENQVSKGDVLEVARLAGIMATKRTDELIPLCHSLGLDSAQLDFEFQEDVSRIRLESSVSVTARTGVEMEALMAVSIAALTIYDMCKSVDRGMRIDGIQLLEKTGGRSGSFQRDA